MYCPFRNYEQSLIRAPPSTLLSTYSQNNKLENHSNKLRQNCHGMGDIQCT
jgi:hypothetical protein